MQRLPPEAELFPADSGACHNTPLGVLLVWLVVSSFGVVCSPPLIMLVLGPLGGLKVQIATSCYVYLALGYLSVATTLFIVCVCIY